MKKEKSETAKYRLAEAVHDLAKRKPVEEISVKEICASAGVSRQTFYRNFLDKNDLINWYFDILLTTSFEEMGHGRTVYDSLVRKFRFIHAEQEFFVAAFKNDEQNNVRDHDFEMIFAFYSDRIKENVPERFTEETQHLLELYCQASIYGTVRWVLGEMDLTPESLASLLVDAMPEKLMDIFREIHLLDL